MGVSQRPFPQKFNYDNYVTSMIITSLLLQAHPQHRSD